jgi:Leucine-rich repeat (LRR) protein
MARPAGTAPRPVLALLVVLLSALPWNQRGAVSADPLQTNRYLEVEILSHLFMESGGGQWKNATDWVDAEADVCSWHGVDCYGAMDDPSFVFKAYERAGFVRSLDLSSNRLAGRVPESIWDMPYLEELKLRDNPDLTVTFENVGKAKHLKNMVLSNTAVKSLEGIGAAGNTLEKLHLTNCDFSGTSFPSEVYDLLALRGMYFNYAGFSGPLSGQAISRMANLTHIYLYENMLTGTIPSEIGKLSDLEVLALASNDFSGTIPMSLGRLTKLEILALQRSEEDAAKPGPRLTGRLPAMAGLRSISEVFLQYQDISGPIPPDFLYSSPADESITVNLFGNQLTGEIPSSLGDRFDSIQLDLGGNEITSIAPNLCAMEKWNMGDVKYNLDAGLSGCDAILCPAGTRTKRGRSHGEFVVCESCPAFSSSPVLGRTEECPGPGAATGQTTSQIRALADLYFATGGESWHVNTNWLSGPDICVWYGVTCDADGATVTGLELSGNGLTGSPPPSFFDGLPSLLSLNLMSNDLDFRFGGIGQMTKLRYLFLSNSGLSVLDGIEELASLPLREIRLAANNLKGQMIPKALFEITTLEYISLSHSGFGGTLPTEIGQLTNLEEFHLFGGDVTGQIPETIGNIGPSLRQLVLSENDFTGTLPMVALNELTNLEVFSAHQTSSDGPGIGGGLPSFSSLTKLTTLHLNSNDLRGQIPDNFLANTMGSEMLDIHLERNQLSGAVPASLMKFQQAVIDVTGNKITSLGSGLCDMQYWNDGDVAAFGCNGILCPQGYYNSDGRQSDGDSGCMPCPSARFMGSIECDVTSDAPTIHDKAVLETLYFETGGPQWKNSAGWAQDSDYCAWYGVTCDSDDNVVRLNLSKNGLQGDIPTDIFRLTNLRELDLQNNDISFSFEGIENADSLSTLYLSKTGLESIEGIGKAKRLRTFHGTNNKISVLPDDLWDAANLELLYLNYNNIGGRIPSEIANLSNLEALYLMHNRLTGQIPGDIGALTNLRVLGLAENNFIGTLPSALNYMRKLEIIAIQRESGTDRKTSKTEKGGLGLTGPLLSFQNLPNLRELYLGLNSLTGTIPFEFLNGLDDKESASLVVDLVGNDLEGEVPSSLAKFDDLSIFLAGNKFKSIAPGLCTKKKWMDGDVDAFGCFAIMCPPNTFMESGRLNADSSRGECKSCPNRLKAPFWGSFECVDDLESEEKSILKNLYTTLGGSNWLMKENWLNDDVSICEWYGIECVSLSDGVAAVRTISLAQNNLVGAVSVELFDLPYLKSLNLARNDIGFSFYGISRATMLQYLGLDEIGLTSLSGIEAAPQLKLLHVIGNNFGNKFPGEIFALPSLEVLYLSKNDIGGALPEQFSALTNLSHFECSECGLSQTIPTWITSLSEMKYLRLDQNSLSGSIPIEIESLSKIDRLDLSDQVSRGGPGLTGRLPRFANLPDLSTLYLFKNNLAGFIPDDFLFGDDNPMGVEVDLRENKLAGQIPRSTFMVSALSIYLAGNQLSGEIPAEVCGMEFTKGFGCDGVMCPPGTFNMEGRQTDASKPCQSCSAAQYFGSFQCGQNDEKEVLSTFFSALNGGAWSENKGWNDPGASICEYYGIECMPGTESIQSIDLENNGLIGNVPTAIFRLPNLKAIKLKSNRIQFSFEGIENANKLEKLHLSETGATSVKGIGMAKSLKYLHLTGNEIATVPSELYELTGLEEIFLNYNNMRGTLSSDIGKLTNLRGLYMFRNQITGQIPTQIGKLQNLEVLALAENFLTGTIPYEVSTLQKLEIVALQRQGGESSQDVGGSLEIKTENEIGAGLTGSVPAFDKMPNLRELYLGTNSLSGTIPSKFLKGIDDKTAPVKVELSQNNLVGIVPEGLSAFSNMKLYISDNQITSIPEDICGQSGWMGGQVAVNGCDAILCRPGTFNPYGRQIDNRIPCESCPFTYVAEYFGSIQCLPRPTEGYSERQVLEMLYQATGGDLWSDSTNWLKGKVPVCEWTGITCDVSPDGRSDPTITKIDLADNNLSGTVPPVIYQLPNLVRVDVSNNEVDFEFEGIEMAPSLSELYLEDIKLSSLDGIGMASKLTVLHVQDNNFGGQPIPEELYDLTDLKSLYLSDSGFGGTLSSKVRNLKDLEEFYCHRNSLTGTLPPELGALSNLEVLQLSENLLVGEIPPQFEGLINLRSLFIDSFDRSYGGLSGPVPSFSGLENLSELSLNGNSFTGSVPTNLLSDLKNKDGRIIVGLQGNELNGILPSELNRFSRMNIDVTGNLITEIDSELCIMDNWQGSDVQRYGCDAILCPPGTFNEYGRQSSDQYPCEPCEGSEQSPYMGSIFCEAREKKKERDILKEFYRTCGGRNWQNSDNWMNDDVDVCDWFGISCKDDATVDSILLGGNNVVGTPPAKLFELPNLKWLWLYSNPIEFKFDGIGNAKQLKSLLLDQTGLKSLRGVGMATSLENLDVRFNNLKGQVPSEIDNLLELKDFGCEGNVFSGALPEFSSLKKLERLRLGGNRFAGALHDYSANPNLSYLDVSDNILSGPIPPTLLKNTNANADVYLDLSSNDLIGEVPGQLSRFTSLTLYLRDNMITEISPALCTVGSVNDGDVGRFSCDGILCPAGSYSPGVGRQTLGREDSKCRPCRAAKNLGSSFCGEREIKSSAVSVRLGFLVGLVGVVLHIFAA